MVIFLCPFQRGGKYLPFWDLGKLLICRWLGFVCIPCRFYIKYIKNTSFLY